MTPPGTPSKRNPSLPVPTDNQLSYPIRRYISETLICHVLGQPSYSLTCLLVCAVSEYIHTSIQFDVPITIEEICTKVYTHVHVHIHVHVRTCTCTYTCMYMYVHECVYKQADDCYIHKSSKVQVLLDLSIEQ